MMSKQDQNDLAHFGLSTPEISEFVGIGKETLWKQAKSLDLLDDESSIMRGKSRIFTPPAVRTIFIKRGFVYKKTIVTVGNLKGGVGKTTLCCAMGYRAHAMGARVLVVDLDKQSNLTLTLRKGESASYSLIDVMKKTKNAKEIICKSTLGFDLFPATLRDAACEDIIKQSLINSKKFFLNLIQSLETDYDLVIFDTPPDLSQIVSLAKLASNKIVIPINLDYYSVVGLEMTLENARVLFDNFKDDGINFSITIVINKYDPRKKTTIDYLKSIQDVIGNYSDIARLDTSIIKVNSELEKLQKIGFFAQGPRKRPFADIDNLTIPLIGLDSPEQIIDGGLQ